MERTRHVGFPYPHVHSGDSNMSERATTSSLHKTSSTAASETIHTAPTTGTRPAG